MSDISSIDKNLKIAEDFGREDIVLYDVLQAPFKVYGVMHEDGGFCRMPRAVAEKVNEGVAALAKNTSGGRVCFSTDSECIAITCTRENYWAMGHMARTGCGGFSLYERKEGKWVYRATFVPPNTSKGYSSIVDLGEKRERELMIQMPLYAPVGTLAVGIAAGSALGEWRGGYTHKKPVVFYGSSITQGGCASTPGGDYAGRACRVLDADYINLGFSGSARGEAAMMEYIAGLPMSCFVYDYDYNAPDIAHLESTHYRGYRTVREANPKLPIIMMSAPNYDRASGDAPARRDVVAATYERALAEGDGNVYFIDGAEHFSTFVADECTVDGTHPNDLGFARMAEAVAAVLSSVLPKF